MRFRGAGNGWSGASPASGFLQIVEDGLGGVPLPSCCALPAKTFCERSRRRYWARATLPALLAFIMFAAVELFGMTGFAIAAMAAVERKSHAALYHLAPRKSKFALND